MGIIFKMEEKANIIVSKEAAQQRFFLSNKNVTFPNKLIYEVFSAWGG